MSEKKRVTLVSMGKVLNTKGQLISVWIVFEDLVRKMKSEGYIPDRTDDVTRWYAVKAFPNCTAGAVYSFETEDPKSTKVYVKTATWIGRLQNMFDGDLDEDVTEDQFADLLTHVRQWQLQSELDEAKKKNSTIEKKLAKADDLDSVFSTLQSVYLSCRTRQDKASFLGMVINKIQNGG